MLTEIEEKLIFGSYIMKYVGKNPKIDLQCKSCEYLNHMFYLDILNLTINSDFMHTIKCLFCGHHLVPSIKLLNSVNQYLRKNKDCLGKKRFFAKVG